ncbi:MAG TPA: hypothetical protein PLK81_09335, partial [Kiritimatiellia bacterium]|nr:hypothetical protein [Kiritimatiellia bacterium]
MKWAAAVAVGLMAGGLSWTMAASAPDSYQKIEAESLQRTPQNAWARAILFSDTLESRPGGRARRLDRKTYLPMRLKAAGTVWVPEDLSGKFQALEPGGTYSFAGTVDQISRRYYVIVDACYRVQTTEDMTEHWTDMLNPENQEAAQADALSETAMQALLLNAQNSLIKLAKEDNMTVAQLIEAQTDGGQRIAEHIVADALQGELRAQGKTADELMIGAVLALLQKQAVLDESARVAAENEAAAAAATEPPVAAEPVPEPEEPPQEMAAVKEEPVDQPVETPEETPPTPAPEAVLPGSETDIAAVLPEPPEEIPPMPTPEAVTAETEVETAAAPEIEAETGSVEIPPSPEPQTDQATGEGEAPAEPAAEEPAAPAETDLAALLPSVEELNSAPAEVQPLPEPPLPEEPKAEPAPVEPQAEAEAIPLPPLPEGEMAAEPVAAPPSSMLVVPLTGDSPDVVPLVSTEPTKAELAQMEKEEQARLKEEQRLARIEAKRKAAEEKKAARLARIEAKRQAAAEKKAAAEELARQREAERQAALEARRLAAEEKKAAAKARKAEQARQKAEEI